MTAAADEHRQVAGAFTALVLGARPDAWDLPAPCEGWRARDVVDHLVTWSSGFLAGGAGVTLPQGPPAADDPVKAWTVHCEAVQALLEDPTTEQRVLVNEYVGEVRLDVAVSRFYTGDVFLHTWDLARATGQDEHLDPERCARMLDEMLPLDDVLRASGHYGPRVDVPEGADVQTRLIAFTGRRP